MSINTKIAWRNIWRNKRRSLLTIGAILFASALLIFSISLQFSSYATMIDAAVKRHTGHLQIQAEGYHTDKEMRLVIAHPQDLVQSIQDLSHIKAMSSRGNAFCLVSSEQRTYGVWVAGVDPARERAVTTISRVIREGSYLSDDTAYEVVLGDILAKNLAVELGDELVLLGQGLDGSIAATAVTVTGIFSTGQPEFDRSALQMPLRAFQETFSMGDAVHELVVVATDLEHLPDLARSIRERLASASSSEGLHLLTWQQLLPGLEQSIRVDMVSGWINYGIVVIIVAFGIMNTFVMCVMERTREFGMLMALGMRPSQVARLVLLEAAFMSLLGIALGLVGGCVITYYFQIHGFQIPGAEEIMAQWGLPSRMWPRLSLMSMVTGPAVIVMVTLLTAVYPVLRIFGLGPARALRAL